MSCEILRVKMFGGLSVERIDGPITRFRTRPVASLFACLVYRAGTAIPRSQLAEMLWPAAEPEIQRRNLRQALFFLKRQTEPDSSKNDLIHSDHSAVVISSELVSTDTARFIDLVHRSDEDGCERDRL